MGFFRYSIGAGRELETHIQPSPLNFIVKENPEKQIHLLKVTQHVGQRQNMTLFYPASSEANDSGCCPNTTSYKVT